MSQTIFDPPQPVFVPIQGEDALFPVRRIFCVGRNYAAHAREMGSEPDAEAPFYFTKAREAYVASGATIPYPPGTANFHHEVELVAAIGAPAFKVTRESALDAVYGYALGLDMTRRDLQNAAKDKQRPWDIGKDFENAAVLSSITPAAQCGHLRAGAISLSVNGAEKQHGDLSDMIHPTEAVVAHLSQYYHLLPGDLIYTGTPEGVGPVKAGDVLEGKIEGLGEIKLTIAAA